MALAKLKAHLRRIGARTIDALCKAIGTSAPPARAAAKIIGAMSAQPSWSDSGALLLWGQPVPEKQLFNGAFQDDSGYERGCWQAGQENRRHWPWRSRSGLDGIREMALTNGISIAAARRHRRPRSRRRTRCPHEHRSCSDGSAAGAADTCRTGYGPAVRGRPARA